MILTSIILKVSKKFLKKRKTGIYKSNDSCYNIIVN